MSKTPAKAAPAILAIQPVSVEAAAAAAALIAGTPPEAAPPAVELEFAPDAAPVHVWPKEARIVSCNDRMLHLYTNVWFDQDSRKVPVAGDDWLIAQIKAGKLAISLD